MDEKVYGYMDWPRIEAIVYGEETAPRDVMGPRITQDGVLIQGFFPDAEEVSVISGKKTYVCEKEDEAGYFAVLLPVRKGAGIQIPYKKMGRDRGQNVMIPMLFHARSQRKRRSLSAQVFIMRHIRSWAHTLWRLKE